MDETGRNKAIVRAWTQGWNERGVSAVDDLFHPDFYDHQLAARTGGDGSLASLKQALAAYASVLADAQFEERDLLAEADRVTIRWILRARHIGNFLGAPPTGRTITVDGANIFRIEDGLIIERWSFFDAASLLAQLKSPE